MGESLVAGACVPSVPKPEVAPSVDTSMAAAVAFLAPIEEAGTRAVVSSLRQRRFTVRGPGTGTSLLCPICTAYGYSFCYMCIVKHLNHRATALVAATTSPRLSSSTRHSQISDIIMDPTRTNSAVS